MLAILLSFRPWQWLGTGAGLRWRRNSKAAWAPGSAEGTWQFAWQLREVATVAAALGGLIVLLLLVSRGSSKGSRGLPNGLKEPATAAEPEALSGPSDPHDIVLTVITSVKSAHTSVTTTLFLDSIFVSLASYRCVIRLVCLLLTRAALTGRALLQGHRVP